MVSLHITYFLNSINYITFFQFWDFCKAELCYSYDYSEWQLPLTCMFVCVCVCVHGCMSWFVLMSFHCKGFFCMELYRRYTSVNSLMMYCWNKSYRFVSDKFPQLCFSVYHISHPKTKLRPTSNRSENNL